MLEDEDYQEDEILVEDEEQNEQEDQELEVDLEEEEEKSSREERDRNRKFAQMRTENKELTSKLNELSEQLSGLGAQQQQQQQQQQSYQNTAGIPQTEEEWDALAEADWKRAVDLRSTINAQTLMENSKKQTQASRTLDESKQRVLAVHPELNDNNSEKSRIFMQILQTNPEYANNPKGPIYAMRDMEDHMENVLGYKRSDIISAERNGAKREATRQNRIVLNSGNGKTGTGDSKKVVLTKDEAEFCKFQGIDPKEYAKNKQKLSKGGGV